MNSLLIAPTTTLQLESFLAKPAHAVRIIGATGIGKSVLGRHLAAQLLALTDEKLDKSAYFKTVSSSDGKSIGIEQARDLTGFLSLKVPGKQQINRIVLIEDCHLLTIEAQNALLKTLEEPPEGTVLILSTSDDQALLPTIRSRSQQISVHKPAKDNLEAYFKAQGHSSTAIARAYAMSSGLPGLMQAILDDAGHPLIIAATVARQLLSQNQYERLKLTDDLLKDKALLTQTVSMMSTMAEIGLQSAKGSAALRWRTILEQSYLANERLQGNAQPKLVLDELFLQI